MWLPAESVILHNPFSLLAQLPDSIRDMRDRPVVIVGLM
jgi:hypothetical protein